MSLVKLKPASKKRKKKVRVTFVDEKPAAAARPKRQARKKRAPAARRPSRREPQPSWWESLSPERKLDVAGVVLALAGALMLVGLGSADRSRLLGGAIELLAQLLGWGVYVLPLALVGVGLWLVLRKIERVPAFSGARAAGISLLYLWLLTTLHAAIAAPENAEYVAVQGRGGGAIGGLFQRLLWAGLGEGGAIVALLAWLTVALAMTFDASVPDLFGWLTRPITRLVAGIRSGLASRSERKEKTPERRPLPPIATNISRPAAASSNGLTPLPATSSVPAAEVPPRVLSRKEAGVPAIQWKLPAVDQVLDAGTAPSMNEDFIQKRARLIEDTLASFGAPAQVVAISRGPAITQFGVEPLFVESRTGRTRVRVSKIASLSDDLALALAAPRIRIQAPVPGHGYVGIEVPNEEMALVALRDIVESETFGRNRHALSFALGRDVAGHPMLADLESMPHLLIAGTTGSGKSVCVNSILTCMLLHNTPDDLRLVLVDPKRVELTNYNGVPHLLGPVVVEMERVVGALQWMTREMDKRYNLFAQAGARNITDYNARMMLQGGRKLPFLIIIIDELADLMMIAPDETERNITRLAQLARATGIHMILATQRPSVDVVTGLIKANFPARIAFAVASGVDSRVIIDQPGAERLLGRGDMLYQAPEAPAPMRLQGVFVSDLEIQKLVEFWRSQAAEASPYAVPGSHAEAGGEGLPLKQAPLWEVEAPSNGDPLYEQAVAIIRREGRASVSMLQRKLRIGYTRAARLVDTMEERGIVSAPEGGLQDRRVLDFGETASIAEE